MVNTFIQTMQHILDVKDGELTPKLVREIHRRVTDGTLSDPDSAGRLRRPDQRITVSDTQGEDLHVPPPAEELLVRMEQMCAFANGLTQDAFIHPVIRSMILHYHADVIRKAINDLYEYIARRTSELVDAQHELAGLANLNQRQRDLIQHVLRHSREDYTIEFHRSQHDVVYETARSDLLDLVARGLMRKRKRGRVWVFAPLADLREKLQRIN